MVVDGIDETADFALAGRRGRVAESGAALYTVLNVLCAGQDPPGPPLTKGGNGRRSSRGSVVLWKGRQPRGCAAVPRVECGCQQQICVGGCTIRRRLGTWGFG